MKLENIILISENGKYSLTSLVSNYHVKLNSYTAKLIENMGGKLKSDFNSKESKIYQQLDKKGFVKDKLSNIESKDKTNKLTSLGIEITDVCNLSCKHCYLGDKKGKTLDINIFKNLIDDFKNLGGYMVDITGGEPLTDKNLMDKVAYLKSQGIKYTMTTNGTLINDDYSDELKKLCIYEVIVSFCGYEKEHDYIYGEGSFKKTVKGIQSLIKSGNNVGINYLAYPNNINVLKSKEFINFCSDLGINRINPAPISNLGYAKGNDKLRLSNHDYSKQFRSESIELPSYDGLNCNAQKKTLFIKSNGDINPCHMFFDYTIGNIYNSKIENILKENTEIKEFKTNKLNSCLKCDAFNECKGGCRGRAYSMTGDLYGKDPESCRIYCK